jgi:ferric-dicitrate binding protein FerR (iron transport regulator)
MRDDRSVSEPTWAEREFRDEPVVRRRALERRGVAGVVLAAALFVFLLAAQHESSKCGNACFDIGVSTNEPGHAWTGYEGAWQWQAEWALALVGLVVAIVATVVGGRFSRRRQAAALTLLAAGLSAAWIAWRILEPAIPS